MVRSRLATEPGSVAAAKPIENCWSSMVVPTWLTRSPRSVPVWVLKTRPPLLRTIESSAPGLMPWPSSSTANTLAPALATAPLAVDREAPVVALAPVITTTLAWYPLLSARSLAARAMVLHIADFLFSPACAGGATRSMAATARAVSPVRLWTCSAVALDVYTPISWFAFSASERPCSHLIADSLAATRAPLLSMASDVSKTRATAIFWSCART